MGSMSPIHWIIVIGVLVLLLGGGKLSGIMGDAAKGVKAFKEGLKDDPAEAAKEAKEAKGEALPRTEKEKEELRS